MPRLQVLITFLLLLSPNAYAICRVHAIGKVRFIEGSPFLVVFAGSLNETTLKLSPAPGANHAELSLQLLGAEDRAAEVTGSCAHAPVYRRGEVFTDLSRVRPTLPDAFKPNAGDELQVDPG